MRSLNAPRRAVAHAAAAGTAALLVLALAACSRTPTQGSQIVARVNADDISVHQLNFAIAQTPQDVRSTPERDALLEKMIDRQLAVQQSLARGLDRRPEVMLRLEEARRDILAAAYAAELSGTAEAPGEDAIARYFAEHPGLFAQRKIYRLREVSIPEGSPALAQAQARLEKKERMTEVIAWLRQQPGRFGDQQTLRPAEQLPIEVADRLRRLQPGDSIAFRLPRALVLYEVLSAEAAPLPWSAAQPIIKAHLAKQRELAAINEDMKRLRAGAKISRNALTSQKAPAG